MRCKLRGESICPRVFWIYAPRRSIHLHYPSISVYLLLPSLSPSSLYLRKRAVAQSSAKLSSGGRSARWIFPPKHCKRSIAYWQSASDQVVSASQAAFRHTWNCLCFVVETILAPYTRASIAARISWILCSHDWWDSVVKRSLTLAFAEFDIFSSWKIHFFW